MASQAWAPSTSICINPSLTTAQTRFSFGKKKRYPWPIPSWTLCKYNVLACLCGLMPTGRLKLEFSVRQMNSMLMVLVKSAGKVKVLYSSNNKSACIVTTCRMSMWLVAFTINNKLLQAYAKIRGTNLWLPKRQLLPKIGFTPYNTEFKF